MATGDGGPATGPPVPPGSGLPPAAAVHVPHERIGVRLARHAFADQLDAVGVVDEARDDAMLVLSELVSNAVKHAAPLPSGQIIVRWSVQADVLHIEITDGGASTRPHASTAALSSLGGRGLDIVRTVSSQWGVTEAGGSVTVWAEVPWSTGGPPAAAH
jgi:anti-sigma regulatory factor (Ser/Thr protein kinase)